MLIFSICNQVTWWRGEEEIKENDRVELVAEGCWRRLVILNTEYNDEAEYTCKCEADETKAPLTVAGLTIQ